MRGACGHASTAGIARLKEIELDEIRTREELDRMLGCLDMLEAAVNPIPTPLAFSQNFYVFRQHIDLVRQGAAPADLT
jgi:hypothetical protein